jgi:XTP/dITP diphosphohydrolase
MKQIPVNNGLSEATKQAAAKQFVKLLVIMDELREHCPWDQKQTHETLRPLTIEETYELAEAIENKDPKGINEELGDLLLHLVFYSKIGAERNEFDIVSVLNNVIEKLIHRHPHIYADVEVKNDDDVKANWEQLKLKEGKTSILAGVPNALPAMIKAMRMQEKARAVGFDWEHIDQVWDKVNEEIDELKVEIKANNTPEMEAELGDVFFALINYARFLNIDPEAALDKTNRKFKSRFMQMEAIIKADNKEMKNMTLTQLDEVWNEVKKQERNTI